MDWRIGAKLPNNATLIRWDNIPGGKLVLAKFGNDYVTWRANSEGECYWGHYHQEDLAGAAAEYSTRLRDTLSILSNY